MVIQDLPLKLKDFPMKEKPRERLLKVGAENLANHELLAILLRTGTKHESVLDLSNRLLRSFDGLRLLKEASVEEPVKHPGNRYGKSDSNTGCS